MRESVALGAEAYTKLRQAMDNAGFRELPLPLDALTVVDRLLTSFLKTSETLKTVTTQAEHYKHVATELEEGIGPFKEETVRLLKENSELRVDIIRVREEFEERLRESESNAREVEVENTDLKYIIQRFLEKVEGKRGRGGESQIMALYGRGGVAVESVIACSACPFCVRVRNYVEFDKGRDPQAQDYLKITDGRMEALQIQIRKLKSSEEDLKAVVGAMKVKVADRDGEIDKLRKSIRPSNVNYLPKKEPDEVCRDLQLALRSKQMQVDLLHRRNIDLENKLKSSILGEHEEWMLEKTKTVAERELVRDLIGFDVNGNKSKLYPTNDEKALLQKLQQLEIQLSNCCKEKASLKRELQQAQNFVQGSTNTVGKHDQLQVEKQEDPQKSKRSSSISKTAKESLLKENKKLKRENQEVMKTSGSDRYNARLINEKESLRPQNVDFDRDSDEMRKELNRKEEKLALVRSDLRKLQGEYSKGRGTQKENERLRRTLELTEREREEAVKALKSTTTSTKPGSRRPVIGESQLGANLEDFEASQRAGIHAAKEQELEREISNLNEDVKEAEDANIILKNQLTSAHSLVASYEEQLEELTLIISTLENQLAESGKKEKATEGDSKAARDLIFTLKTKMDKLKQESGKHKLEAEKEQRKVQLEMLEKPLTGELERGKKLEEVMGAPREKEFTVERTAQESSQAPQKSTRESSVSKNAKEVESLLKENESLKRENQEIMKTSGSDRYNARLISELESLRNQNVNFDRDCDEMRKELNRKDEELASVNSDLRRLVGESRKAGGAQKEIERLKRILELTEREREEAVKALKSTITSTKPGSRRPVGKSQVGANLENFEASQRARIQAAKEQELEREISNLNEDVQEGVDANIILKNQLTSAHALVASYEEQLEDLKLRISMLENQLATYGQKEKATEGDSKAARDLMFALETKLDKLKLDLAKAESVKHKLEAQTEEQKVQMEMLEEQLKAEIERRKKLEEIMGAAREKDFTVERTTQESGQVPQRSTRGSSVSKNTKELESLLMENEKLRRENQEIMKKSGSDRYNARLKRELESLRRENDRLEVEKQEILRKSTRASSVPINARELESLLKENEKLKRENQEITQQLNSSDPDKARLKKELEWLRREYDSLHQEKQGIFQIPKDSSVSKSAQQLESLLKQNDKLKRENQEIMKTSGGDRYNARLINELESLRRQNLNFDRDCDEMRKELNRKDEKLALVTSDLRRLQGESSKAGGAQKEIERLRRTLELTEREREEAVKALKSTTTSTKPGSRWPAVKSQFGGNLEDFEASQRARIHAAKEQELEREISHLKASLTTLDVDKDEMRVELDRKDERLARMRQDCEVHLAEVSRLTLQLRNMEVEIGSSGHTAMEHAREVTHLKHEIEMLRRDLDSMAKERDEALKDCRKLAGAVSKEEIERRSLHSELDKTSKEADDLRKQVHKYIEEVRRIEELLLQKEEEMESLIEHYRSLSLEKSTLETHRSSLELQASSIREDVKEAVDANIILKNQLTSAHALVASYEEQLEDLTLRISTLENQLASSGQREKATEGDSKAARDLIFTLETKMDKLKLDLATTESVKHKLEAQTEEQKAQMEMLEEQLKAEIERGKKLEEIMGAAREKEFTVERTTQELAQEKSHLSERLKSLQTRTETLNEEVSRYRLRSMELQNELERTKRQLQSEKTERESALSELRRVQDQLNNSSTNRLLTAAMGGGTVTSPMSAPTSGLPFSPMSDSYLDSPPLGASTRRGRDQEAGSLADDHGDEMS